MQFAKDQLWYLLFDQFQHPNGQVPAYEWEFSDLNPPVQGWAALRLFQMEEKKTGKRDIDFLKKCFHKHILNFVWGVNKVDACGNNVFEGGFLGLDNITVIDRSEEIRKDRNDSQTDDHYRADHSNPTGSETPPDKVVVSFPAVLWDGFDIFAYRFTHLYSISRST